MLTQSLNFTVCLKFYFEMFGNVILKCLEKQMRRCRSKLFNKTARKIYSYISFKINIQNSII